MHFQDSDKLAKHFKDPENHKRQHMHIHAGVLKDGTLRDTQGCIRMSEEDIVRLKEITDRLECLFPDEELEECTVDDDLSTPVDYLKDKEKVYYDRYETPNNGCVYHKAVNPIVYSGSESWVMMNAYMQQLDEENNK